MAELTIDEIKTQLEEWVKGLVDNIRVKHAVFEQDNHGVWTIDIPERAENVRISSSAGGASGEGLVDYEKYGADGQNTVIELYRKNNTLIERIELDGGITGAISPLDGLSSADGQSNTEGKGGIVASSEEADEQDGERRGAGGCSAGFITFDAWAGGSGEELLSYTPSEKPSRIVFTIGKGGDINDIQTVSEDDAGMKTSPGNGANGFARVEYLIGTIRTFEEEGVRGFTKGR